MAASRTNRTQTWSRRRRRRSRHRGPSASFNRSLVYWALSAVRADLSIQSVFRFPNSSGVCPLFLGRSRARQEGRTLSRLSTLEGEGGGGGASHQAGGQAGRRASGRDNVALARSALYLFLLPSRGSTRVCRTLQQLEDTRRSVNITQARTRLPVLLSLFAIALLAICGLPFSHLNWLADWPAFGH